MLETPIGEPGETAAPVRAGAAPGGLCEVLQVFADSADDAALIVVMACVGSTWSKPGMAMLVDAHRHLGWLSGGCLEADLCDWARQQAATGRAQLRSIDTSDDADRMVGSGLGCRGQLQLLALPRALFDSSSLQLLRAPLNGHDLELASGPGGVELRQPDSGQRIQLCPAIGEAPLCARLPAAPLVWLFGCGPETLSLSRMLSNHGWRVHALERRPRWQTQAASCHRQHALLPRDALAQLEAERPLAALVASHSFELDHQALQLLAKRPPPFVGLLGPPLRRDELLSLLDAGQREALLPVLRAPVGLRLGGHGEAAIALSITAQLEQFRHRLD